MKDSSSIGRQSSNSLKLLYAFLFLLLIFSGYRTYRAFLPEQVSMRHPGVVTPRDTLRLISLLPRLALNPYRADDVEDVFLCNQIYSGLVRLDASLAEVPDLAERWEISPDRTTYTFYLRPNASFHDGKPVRAQDVVASLYFAIRKLKNRYFGPFVRIIQGVEPYQNGETEQISGISQLDSLTIQFKLRRPYAPFLMLLSIVELKILPRWLLQQGMEAVEKTPIGSGPYRLVRRDEKGYLLAKFPGYFQWDSTRGLPYVRIYFLSELVENLLDEGNFDLIYFHPEGYNFDPRLFQKFQYPSLAVTLLNMNCQRFPTSIPQFRKAIARGLSKNKLIGEYKTLEQEAVFPCPLYLPREPSAYQPRIPSLSEARKQLQAIRDSLHIAEFPVLEIAADTNYFPHPIYLRFSRFLDSLGLKNNIRYYASLPWDQEQHYLKQFHFSFLGWNMDLPDPQFFFDIFFKSNSPSNITNYNNPAVDSLLTLAGQTVAYQYRLRLYVEVEQYIMQDLPVLPISFLKEILFLRKNLRNISLNRLGLASVDLSKIEQVVH